MIKTLTGSNSFGLKLELDRLVQNFLKAHGDMALERLDGEDVEFDRIRESLESMPFLSNKKMVVLRAPSSNKTFVEQAEKLLTNLPDSTDVVIVEPKLDKRLSYFKFLQKNTELKQFNELDEFSLARWLVGEAKAKGGSLSQADAKYLVEQVGTNQQLLANELAKLQSYAPAVTKQSIELLVEPTPQSTIFELLDAAFGGNTNKAIELYQEQRALKVEPQQIMAMLVWQLHILALIKAAGQKSVDDIAREAKLNPFVVRKSQTIARQTTPTELKNLIQRALDLDVRFKSESINTDDALQHFLLTLSLGNS